jgi:AMP phosphorylase
MGDDGLRDLKVTKINACQGAYEVLLNADDAHELAIDNLDRIELRVSGRSLVVIVNTTETMVGRGEIGIFCEAWDAIVPEEGTMASIIPISRPRSVEHIKKKIRGQPLTEDEIRELVEDTVSGRLSNREITAYSVAVQIVDMSMEEIVYLTKAMVDTGETIEFSRSPVFDVHSIGGVPGNKYAAIAVPIAAAAGLLVPKTSSRAISSACGTADFMEVVTDVVHSAEEIMDIAQRTGATLVWGGGVNLAPADDIIIKAERPLSLDPHCQLLASVMAKKIASGVQKLLIDVPMGRGTKVETEEEARRLARDFIELGRRLGVEVRCAITYGGQPIGRAIGPALEVKEALGIMEGTLDIGSIREKALELSGVMIEMGKMAPKGKGKEHAEEILASGRALEKFREIVEAQGGDAGVSSADIAIGGHSEDILSPRHGYVELVRNRCLVRIARTAGAPRDKGAGVLLHKKEGESIAEGEPLLTIHADARWKLDAAIQMTQADWPVRIEGMILEEVIE